MEGHETIHFIPESNKDLEDCPVCKMVKGTNAHCARCRQEMSPEKIKEILDSEKRRGDLYREVEKQKKKKKTA